MYLFGCSTFSLVFAQDALENNLYLTIFQVQSMELLFYPNKFKQNKYEQKMFRPLGFHPFIYLACSYRLNYDIQRCFQWKVSYASLFEAKSTRSKYLLQHYLSGFDGRDISRNSCAHRLSTMFYLANIQSSNQATSFPVWN